jgi:hypothetical protein
VESPPESLKAFTRRLAELAMTEKGTAMTHLMFLTGLLADYTAIEPQRSSQDDPGSQAVDTSPASNERRIGIWEPKQENGKAYFVRSQDMVKDWNYWSNIGRIEQKGRRLRVILMGESVARGYLYDPLYTPAMALAKILKAHLHEDGVEVIDLARIDMGMEVKDLAIDALQLQPDAAIIFSGNNWRSPFPPRTTDIPYLDSLLRKEGMAGVKRFAEQQLAADVERLVSDVATVYKNRKVPLVWIIPEFNLGDWREPILNAPHLSVGANREWLHKRQSAEEALQAGDLKTASELAEGMVQLDGGIAVAGLYILAECSRRAGDLGHVRHYLELARDSAIWDMSTSASPRSYSVVQQTLREGAMKYGNDVVDLPRLFVEQLNGEIPDRRLFIDYCHLTARGIQTAMAAAASCVIHALKGINVPWQNLKASVLLPAAGVQAETSFLAAIHNAHWLQPYELVYHYCSQAVQLSPEIARVMDWFIDLQTHRVPILMCKAAEQISAFGSPLIQRYLLQFDNQQLDPLLLSAVVNSLKHLGIEAGQRVDQLRRQEHSVTAKSTNLLEYYYCSAGCQPLEVAWVLPKRDKLSRRTNNYYRAFWFESRFAFVGDADCPVNLHFTCRVPNRIQGDVSIYLNDKGIADLAISRDWSTWDILVPGSLIRNGVNSVAVRWPIPDFSGLEGYAAVMADLLEGKVPEFYCSFGEIFAFRASEGGIAPNWDR